MGNRSDESGQPGKGLRRTPRVEVPRVQLDTLVRVRRELSRLYFEAKAGLRPVADVSKLANVLQIVARLVEGGELERRMDELEREVARSGGAE